MTAQPICTHAAVNGDAARCPCRYTAREHLRCWINLLDARIAADNAAEQLTGTRAAPGRRAGRQTRRRHRLRTEVAGRRRG